MIFDLKLGTAPLLVSMPHFGSHIPEALHANYVPRALQAEDTDWHLDRLYDWLPAMGASVLRPVVSRYVIDLNRPPDDAPMYPGASNTELCPTRFFTGDPLYVEGRAPDAAEKLHRREIYWQPYHAALAAELERIRAVHGYVLLWDAHSIRAQIPWLFDGVLPDLNLGTASGDSADVSVGRAVEAAAARHADFTHVLNGRFRGGYITRKYGDPGNKVHAVQLEMVQRIYMQEVPPYNYEEAVAKRVQPVIKDMMESALAACAALYGR